MEMLSRSRILVVLACLLVPLGAYQPRAEERAQSAPQTGQENQSTGKKTSPQQAGVVEERKGKKAPAPSRPVPGAANAAGTVAPAPGPLRFTDEDLEKYHKPKPGDAAEEEEVEETLAAPGVPPAAAPAARRPPVPPRNPAVPAVDPLKPFRERELKEKFRQEQLQRARDRVAEIEKRLGYLRAKKDAIENPAQVLPGQTKYVNDTLKDVVDPPPPKEGEPPPRPFSPIRGPGKVPIGGFFPNLPPPQTEADAEADKKMKVKDLLEAVDAEIKTQEEALEDAKADLVGIETRFAREDQYR